jgi:hypothetical protein
MSAVISGHQGSGREIALEGAGLNGRTFICGAAGHICGRIGDESIKQRRAAPAYHPGRLFGRR